MSGFLDQILRQPAGSTITPPIHFTALVTACTLGTSFSFGGHAVESGDLMVINSTDRWGA